jgi:hypothetical protein
MTAIARIGDKLVTHAVIRVPAFGPWYADVDVDNADLSGRQTLTIGNTNFVGTVDPRFNGTFATHRGLRLVAGANGWGTILPPKSYHNDGGVRANNVAIDAAREAGETLSTFSPSQDTVGNDFVRRAGAASIALEQAAGTSAWWVDYDGNTHVEAHPATTPAASAYEVDTVDPRANVVEFACDDAGAVRVGATLTERLDAPVVVRELEITVGETVRVKAWCSNVDSARGRMINALKAIVDRQTAGHLWGVSRYRVGQMNGDRYELQSVRRGVGLPDVIPCSAWPGVSGSHSIPQNGAECLVQFIDGDPGQPIVTHWAGKDGVGWIPTEAILAASSLVRLGSATANRALALATETKDRLDRLQIAHDNHIHAFTGTGTVGAVNLAVGTLGPIDSARVVTDG